MMEGSEKNSQAKFAKGTMVEVKRDVENFEGSCFTAKSVGVIGNDKFLVKYYLTLRTDDETEPLKEEAHAKYIRPCLVPLIFYKVTVLEYMRKLMLGIMMGGGWVMFLKFFATLSMQSTSQPQMEELEFDHSALSPHQYWIDGKWVLASQVFDCRLHGRSQNLINPSEKHSSLSEVEEDGKPCSDQCFLRLRVNKKLLEGSVINASHVMGSTILDEREHNGDSNMDIVPDQRCMTEKVITAASEAACGSEVNVEVSNLGTSTMAITHLESLGKLKVLEHINTLLQDSLFFSEDTHDSLGKKQKQSLDSNVVPVPSEVITVLERDTSAKNQHLHDKNEHDINVCSEHQKILVVFLLMKWGTIVMMKQEMSEKFLINIGRPFSGKQEVQQTTGSEWKTIERTYT